MYRIVWIFLLAFATPSLGQDFEVVSSSPANGAAGIAQNGAVAFEFSAAIDTSARFPSQSPIEFLSISPSDSISTDSVRYSSDLRTVTYYVRQADNTDYVWILTGARSQLGEPLFRPYAVNYSTASSPGPWSVSGEAAGLYLVKRGGEWPSLIVALADGQDLKAGRIVAATVTDSTSFRLDGVRNGTYWPGLAADINLNGIIEPAGPLPEVRMYERDNVDGADSVVVADSSLAGLQLSIALGGASERNQLESNIRLAVYPNPTSGRLNLEFETEKPLEASIRIVDLLGRTTIESPVKLFAPGTHNVTFDMSQFSSGVYVLLLTTESGAESRVLSVLR